MKLLRNKAQSHGARAQEPHDRRHRSPGDGASSWATQNCDTVLILGSTTPWFEYYPQPGQARGEQVDVKADRLGLRYPVEIRLVGDVDEQPGDRATRCVGRGHERGREAGRGRDL